MSKKVQIFSKNNEGSLMTWMNVPDKWNTQKIITYIQKLTASLEMNIVWIKVSGKKILDNFPKTLNKEKSK